VPQKERNSVLNRRSGLALLTAAALAACGNQGSSDDSSNPSFKAEDQEIIRGFASAGYEAVGTVGIVYKGQYYMLCTATLVAPQVVLTAKHCAVFLDDMFTPPGLVGQPLLAAYKVAFATGNANKPTAIYEAVDSYASTDWSEGFVGLGNDVAVYLLKDKVTDLKTLPFATEALSPDFLGKKAVAMGYGSQTNLQDATGELDGSRKAGSVTVSSYDAKVYELIFGSFDAFLKDLEKYYGAAVIKECLADKDCQAMVQGWYDNTKLKTGYELWAASQKGDAVTCHGDSGGPLLLKTASASDTPKLQILGVVSGGMGSDELACDYGTVYATFGPTTQELLKNALAWEDPCSLGAETLSTTGTCDGTVATRCSNGSEGHRTVLSMDCALLDQTCDVVDGLAGCVDAEGRTAEPKKTPVEAPAPGVLQGAVERASVGVTGKPAAALFAKFKK
jgi:V8-like Glu-specific endopeptidase